MSIRRSTSIRRTSRCRFMGAPRWITRSLPPTGSFRRRPSALSAPISNPPTRNTGISIFSGKWSGSACSASLTPDPKEPILRARAASTSRSIAPYPAYSNIDEIESGGNSEYQSFQFSFKRRMANGLAVLASYTRSKSIDDTSAFLPTSPDQNFPQDSHDYRLNRGLSSYDVPNIATVGFVYDIPCAWRWARGFQLSGIVTAESGQPFTPVLNADNSNTGNGGIPTNFGLDLPNVVGNPVLSNPTPQEWFNVNAFAIPPQYAWGNAGRKIGRASWRERV